MLKEDWILGQISSIITMLKKLLKKDDEEIIKDLEEDKEANIIYKNILQLLNQGKINEAENIIFENIDMNENVGLIAIEFYSKINQLSNEELNEKKFSREEVYEGILDISKSLGYNLKF